MKFWIKETLIAVDQTINALVFFGWADETLSSRAWRMQHQFHFKIFRVIIDTVFFFQPDHCYKSYLGERERLQEPPELRRTKRKQRESFLKIDNKGRKSVQ